MTTLSCLAADPRNDKTKTEREAAKALRAQDLAALQDPWLDWKPDHTTPATPHGLQEKNNPTAQEEKRARQDPDVRRRIVDARLWAAMSPSQQDAAVEIELAHATMGRGIGYVASDWKRIPGCRGQNNIAEAHARLVSFYVDWSRRCLRQKICHSSIIDVLCHGHSCRAVDRNRRQRAGTARQNLLAGLSVYCAMRGWPER